MPYTKQLASVALLIASLWTVSANAQTREIPYEGVLDDGGAPANGDYFFEFTLCDLQDCSGQQWQSGEVTLTATSGRFNTSLGAAGQPPLDDWIFSDDEVWLSVDVGDTSGALIALTGSQKIVPAHLSVRSTETVPVGTVIASMVPPDASDDFMSGSTLWALADGSAPSGISYSIGDFPDLRGVFLRGVNMGRSDGREDPEDGRDMTLADVNGAGSYQTDEFAAHTHGHIRYAQTTSTGNTSYPPQGADAPRPPVQTESAGGSETRPKNVGVYYYIKVR